MIHFTKIARKAGLAALVAFPAVIQASSAAAQLAPPPPTKEFRIYNNSDLGPIYPVISTPKQGLDLFMQAIFKTPKANLETSVYANNNVYRIYINPTTGGIPKGGSVVLTVPKYTQLLTTTTGAVPDEFIDWWTGGRLSLYDVATAIKRNLKGDSKNPTTPLSGAALVTCKSGCNEPLAIYQSAPKAGDLPSNDPAQLTEYTLGGIDEKTVDTKGYITFEPEWVDYDISYVDQVYLPIAMEAVDAPFIGWVGTIQGVGTFKGALQTFLDSPLYPGWPTYLDDSMQPILRIPSPAIIYSEESGANPSPVISKPGQAFNDMTALWKGCTNPKTDSTTSCGDIQAVQTFFLANYSAYKAAWFASNCLGTPPPDKPDTVKMMLPHVYGWAAFNEAPPEAKCNPALTNALYNTPGYDKEKYQEVEAIYKSLQYDTPNGEFNPYVQLVHFKPFLNMVNAYGFSIDDAVGNMRAVGNGLVITVGGAKGLPNPNPFDKTKTVQVTVGAPGPGLPTWKEYGFCSPYPNGVCQVSTPYVGPQLSFDLLTVTYPTEVVLLDSANREYKFVIKSPPPYAPSPGNNKPILCLNLTTEWCQFINAYTNPAVGKLPLVNAAVGRVTLPAQ